MCNKINTATGLVCFVTDDLRQYFTGKSCINFNVNKIAKMTDQQLDLLCRKVVDLGYLRQPYWPVVEIA